MPMDAEFGWLERQPPSQVVQLVLLKRNTINYRNSSNCSFIYVYIYSDVDFSYVVFNSCQLIIKLKKILLSKDSASQYKLQSR